MIGADGYVGFQRGHRIHKGGSVLNLQPAHSIRVVAAPNLGLIIEHSRVKAAAPAATPAEEDFRMGQDNAVHYVVQSENVSMVNLPLFFFLGYDGPGIRDKPVHIPLHIFDFRAVQHFID